MSLLRSSRSRRPWLAILGALLVVAPADAQRPATNAGTPSFKGVFEPVPFPADVALNDVFFVTPDVGWATGGNGMSNGVIIGTTDGGASWTVQVGDPESSERPYSQLRFVDGRIGFAAQSAPGSQHRLLRTTDGEHWTVVGSVPEHRRDYAFVTANVGVTVQAEKILRTEDAGRTWKDAFLCQIKVQAAGLTRNAKCYIEAFHFPTRRVGYGIGHSYDALGVFMVKTEDAGASWTAWMTLPEERGYESHLFFTDENHGTACLTGGKFVATEDGGRTWTAVPGPACEGKPAVRFADPEVGWTAVYSSLNFTVNGGRSWSGRSIAFPAQVAAFSLPRRDRGFVVGDHGMVYRYRVIPTNEPETPGSLSGPAMPGMETALDEYVSDLYGMISELEASVEAAPDTAPTPADPTLGAAESGFDPPFYEPQPFDPSADAVPLPSADLPDASPFTVSCCGQPQSRLSVLLGIIVGTLPELLENQRNTNTLGGALLMLVELPLKVTGVRNAIAAFWQAPDKAAAQQALADLRTAAADLESSTAMVLQREPSQFPGFDAASDGSFQDGGNSGVLDGAVKAVRDQAGGLLKKKVRIP